MGSIVVQALRIAWSGVRETTPRADPQKPDICLFCLFYIYCHVIPFSCRSCETVHLHLLNELQSYATGAPSCFTRVHRDSHGMKEGLDELSHVRFFHAKWILKQKEEEGILSGIECKEKEQSK